MNYYDEDYEGGYIDYSRSRRSQLAIDTFEVPFSHINKKLILEYLAWEDVFSESEIKKLGTYSAAMWKFAGERTDPTSWHHVGPLYRKVDHFELKEIAESLLENGEKLQKEYQVDREKAKEEKNKKQGEYKFGCMKFECWNRWDNKAFYVERYGIVKGKWMYYKEPAHLNKMGVDVIKKCNIYGKKVDDLNVYDTYKELVKNNPSYKNMKKKFTFILKNIEPPEKSKKGKTKKLGIEL